MIEWIIVGIFAVISIAVLCGLVYVAVFEDRDNE